MTQTLVVITGLISIRIPSMDGFYLTNIGGCLSIQLRIGVTLP